MVFYKGAVSYRDLLNMPVTEVYELQHNANLIIKEINAEVSKNQRK